MIIDRIIFVRTNTFSSIINKMLDLITHANLLLIFDIMVRDTALTAFDAIYAVSAASNALGTCFPIQVSPCFTFTFIIFKIEFLVACFTSITIFAGITSHNAFQALCTFLIITGFALTKIIL